MKTFICDRGDVVPLGMESQCHVPFTSNPVTSDSVHFLEQFWVACNQHVWCNSSSRAFFEGISRENSSLLLMSAMCWDAPPQSQSDFASHKIYGKW